MEEKNIINKIATYFQTNPEKTAIGLVGIFLVFSLLVAIGGSIKTPDMDELSETGDLPEIIEVSESFTVGPEEEARLDLINESATFQGDAPPFVVINKSTLIMVPSEKDIGNYYFNIIAEEGDLDYVYNITINVILPAVNFDDLESKVREVIGNDEIDRYAVYVYDLLRKDGFDINGDQIMWPGSTSKLPYAINVLRDVDMGKYTLASVDSYLKRMIQNSDNEAMMYLDNLLGGYAVHNERVKEELGIDNYFRYPHTCTANDIGETYYNIYHQKYLSVEMNSYLLNLMINANPGFDNRLKQGIPDEIEVAHKTGYVGTDYGVAYNDTALIFGNQTDFILVVLDKDTTQTAAVANMKPIAEAIYSTLDAGADPTVLGVSTYRWVE